MKVSTSCNNQRIIINLCPTEAEELRDYLAKVAGIDVGARTLSTQIDDALNELEEANS